METADRIEADAARRALAEIVGMARAWQFMAEVNSADTGQLVRVLARIEECGCGVMPHLREEAITEATTYREQVA